MSTPDLEIWREAPRERTATYFPVYAAVSKAMQRQTREWVREWFREHPEILERPISASAVLAYIVSTPFAEPTNNFGYDIHDTPAMEQAFRSMAYWLPSELRKLKTSHLDRITREHYYAYRSKKVVQLLAKNRVKVYRMLKADTALMNAVLKFAVVEIGSRGLNDASQRLRKSFVVHLKRLSDEFDLSGKAEELLAVASEALRGKLEASPI